MTDKNLSVRMLSVDAKTASVSDVPLRNIVSIDS
jgi:hypothetical protein